jgi:hypothetical protein
LEDGRSSPLSPPYLSKYSDVTRGGHYRNVSRDFRKSPPSSASILPSSNHASSQATDGSSLPLRRPYKTYGPTQSQIRPNFASPETTTRQVNPQNPNRPAKPMSPFKAPSSNRPKHINNPIDLTLSPPRTDQKTHPLNRRPLYIPRQDQDMIGTSTNASQEQLETRGNLSSRRSSFESIGKANQVDWKAAYGSPIKNRAGQVCCCFDDFEYTSN